MSHEVRYTNEYHDFVAFYRHYLRWSPAVIGLLFVALVLTTASGLRQLPTNSNLIVNITVWLVVALLPVVLLAALFALGIMLVSLYMARSQTTEYTAILTAETFIEQSVASENVTTWNDVHKVAQTETHLILYTSPRAAYIIPRRAFPSQIAWNEFVTFCERKVSGEKSVTYI